MVVTSDERLLVVLVVRESENMEEMEEDGVWVLCEGGGVEDVSVLRSVQRASWMVKVKGCEHSSETQRCAASEKLH